MELVEIRDLDGPNLFALEPVIKLEVAGLDPQDPRIAAISRTIAELNVQLGLPRATIGVRGLDRPGHVAISFPWQWRGTAMAIARQAFELVAGLRPDPDLDQLNALLNDDHDANDAPLWVRDADRATFTIGVTGTNGKTTTTRMLAHIARISGRHVGWSSTAGVFVDGECIIEGDYTGPSGARTVLQRDDVDLAIVETARGGLLLRGAGYESNDVGMFLNVSADHLHLQGVETLETLAEVKSVVVRVTRPDGVVVLNADDPLVAGYRRRVRAEVVLFSQNPANEIVAEHIAAGGRAIVEQDGRIVSIGAGGAYDDVVAVADVPAAHGGAAVHMVANALAATAGALSAGFTLDEVREGLRSFRSDSTLNPGRLNVFDVGGSVLVIDYAHNEDGLRTLIRFSRQLIMGNGRLYLVVGTAGDRQDSVFEGLGEIAATLGDQVILKDTPRYRRGRAPGEMVSLMRRGAEATMHLERIAGSYGDELSATIGALESAGPGDVIAVMCQEDFTKICDEVRRRGGVERI